jgi:hypothetical protein
VNSACEQSHRRQNRAALAQQHRGTYAQQSSARTAEASRDTGARPTLRVAASHRADSSVRAQLQASHPSLR